MGKGIEDRYFGGSQLSVRSGAKILPGNIHNMSLERPVVFTDGRAEASFHDGDGSSRICAAAVKFNFSRRQTASSVENVCLKSMLQLRKFAEPIAGKWNWRHPEARRSHV